MPTLKKSPSQRYIYSGLNGKQLFYDAMNFLFTIKGKEFTKQYPSFLTPTVDEFLCYTTIVERCEREAQRAEGNKGKKSKQTNLHHFLSYLCCDMEITTEVLRCLYIVQFALASYSVTDYFLMGADTVSEAWMVAFLWYTTHYMPKYGFTRDILDGTVNGYMSTLYFAHIHSLVKNYQSDEHDATAIGTYIVHELHHADNMRLYDMLVQIPYSAIFVKKGIDSYRPWLTEKIRIYQ